MCAVSQYEYFISSDLLASVWVWLSGQSLLSLGFPDSHELLCAPGPPGEDTLAPPDEPVPHVGVDLVLGQISRHQPLTELAVVGDTDVADHLVVRPPGEVGGELQGRLEEAVQVACQRGGGGGEESVDVRFRRKNVRIVRASEHHRDGVQAEGVERFLCDIVLAESILKTQIELVFPVDQVKARVPLRAVLSPHVPGLATLEVPALPVDVDPDVSLEPPDVLHPAVVVVTVRDEPDDGCRVASPLG